MEQRDDLGCAKKDAGDEDDIHQPAGEIVEFAAEDQHAAGHRNGGKGDETGDWAGDRFLNLFERRLPGQAACRPGKGRFAEDGKEQEGQPAQGDTIATRHGVPPLVVRCDRCRRQNR